MQSIDSIGTIIKKRLNVTIWQNDTKNDQLWWYYKRRNKRT